MSEASPDEQLKVIPLDVVGATPRRHSGRPRPGPSLIICIVVAVAVVVATLGYLTRPPAPPLEWQSVDLPEASAHIESLIATATGFVVASGPDRSGTILWSTTDGHTWSSIQLERAPTRLVADGDDLLGYDARTAFRISQSGEMTDIPLPDLLRTGYGSGRAGLVPGHSAVLAHTVMGDVWRSFADGPFLLTVNADRWLTAIDITLGSRCAPPGRTGPDLPPVVVTPEGFMAYVAADDASGVWPLCEPVPWTSGDGAIWKRESADSPFGIGAYVTDLDWSNDRFVAVGGFGFEDPALWTSDDGLEWDRIGTPRSRDPYEFIEVEGGPAGWVALAKLSERPGYTGWISSNGDCWESLPENVTGRTVAVGPNSILIGDRSNTTTLHLGTPSRKTC